MSDISGKTYREAEHTKYLLGVLSVVDMQLVIVRKILMLILPDLNTKG